MGKKTILVFTGGGLAPALNPTLYGAISRAKKEGFKVLGGLYGWACLSAAGKTVDLTGLDLETIKENGGTFLRSSRANPFSSKNGLAELKQRIKKLNINYIIAIGGDDTLGAAYKLHQQSIIPIVGAPKTIDNDLPQTYWSPGFPSAAYYFSQFVKEIKEDAAYALSRIFIVECFGSTAGWPVATGALGGADVIIPPEKPIDLKLIIRLIAKRYKKNKNFAVIAISNQAKISGVKGEKDEQKDQFGVKRQNYISLALAKKIKSALGVDTKVAIPANYLETGKPIRIDREIGIKLGQKAVELIKANQFGQMAIVARPRWQSNKITVKSVPLDVILNGKKVMDESFFDFKNLKVKQKMLDYLEPMLGKYEPEKNAYLKLIKKIKNYA